MKSKDQTQFENTKRDLLAVLPRLQRYARNLSGNAADADDLLQATSERVLSRWKQFRPGSDFDRWAFTIMHSIRMNHLRAESVRFGHGHESAEESLRAPESQSPEWNKMQQQVFDKVEALPTGQRQVMLLVYQEGFSYRATAEILSIPIGTVMSRIGRARIKLAADLQASDRGLTSRLPIAEHVKCSTESMTGERTGSCLPNSDEAVVSGQRAGLRTVWIKE